jgi:FixJ family two-component response regulator
MDRSSRAQIFIIGSADNPHRVAAINALSAEFDVKRFTFSEKNELLALEGKVPKAVVLILDDCIRFEGLELCSLVKSSEQFRISEVMVLDRNTTIDEKMEIYESGASDLLVYPFVDAELVKKVSLAIFRATHMEESALQAKSAMETAMSAIMDAGEMGSVIHFMRDSFTCKTIIQLADLIIESALRFGLSSSIQISTSWEAVNRTSSDSLSPLEIEMLDALQSAGRIHQKGKRLLLHFGPISQIIKNLPEEDEYKCGRLRDHLALILEGANSRLQAIVVAEEMKNIMEETNDSIRVMHQRQSDQKKQNVKIMDEMLEEIQGEFFRHGLTEEQESVLISMVDKYVEKIFSTYEAGLKVDEEMAMMADRLKRALDKAAI